MKDLEVGGPFCCLTRKEFRDELIDVVIITLYITIQVDNSLLQFFASENIFEQNLLSG